MHDDPALIEFVERTLHTLCVQIGARPVGSASSRQAQELIGTLFEEHGCTVEYQGFDCIDWQGHSAELLLAGQPLPALPAPYTLPCDVTAEAVPVGSLEELEAADLTGRIAVLHADLAREPLMPKNFRFWNPEEHQHIIRLLEEQRPAALIAVSYSADLPIPVIEDGDFDIPGALIAGKHGPALLAALPGPLALRIDSTRAPARAANVIARRPGPPGRPRVVLTAHMDTKPGTPGALDNAAGVITLLLASRLLQGQALAVGLEFVAINGEDYYSNPGEIAYLDRFQAEFPAILLNINVDGVGLRGSPLGASLLECPPALAACLEQARLDFPHVEMIAPWYQGDHMIFVMGGVPALTLTSSGIFALLDTVIHTDQDTPAHVDPARIVEAARYLAQAVSACAAPG